MAAQQQQRPIQLPLLLFADNAGFETTSQIFIDCKAPYYDLANDTPKLTEAEFLEMVGAAG